MLTRRKKIILAVFMAAISIISAFAILDYLYSKQTDFNGVYKFAYDPYYSGTSLPPSYTVPAYMYAYNMTGNFTAHYRLVTFPYIIWENESFGSFEFGVTLGSPSPGPVHVQGIPSNAQMHPYIWIGLLKAKYNFSGSLGFKPIDVSAFSDLPFLSPINLTNVINPSVWSMYNVNQTANLSTRNVTINTLGTVNYLYPLISTKNTDTYISTLYAGEYYLVLKMDLYSITPFQTHKLTTMNITEPWIYVE